MLAGTLYRDKMKGDAVLPTLYSESTPEAGLPLVSLLPEPTGSTDQSSMLVKCELMCFVVTAPIMTLS